LHVSGRGRNVVIFDYCSQDMVPPEGGASRNRETMYAPHMGPFAGKVKRREKPADGRDLRAPL